MPSTTNHYLAICRKGVVLPLQMFAAACRKDSGSLLCNERSTVTSNQDGVRRGSMRMCARCADARRLHEVDRRKQREFPEPAAVEQAQPSTAAAVASLRARLNPDHSRGCTVAWAGVRE